MDVTEPQVLRLGETSVSLLRRFLLFMLEVKSFVVFV